MSQRETGTEARQGDRGKPTLIALVVGVVLALAIGVGLLTYQGSKTPSNSSSESNQQPVQPKP